MNEQDRHNLFSELIVRHQSELYGYIFAIARNWEDTDDLYQSVCLVLWSKFDSFRPGSSFFSWARQTAKLTARSFIKRKQSRTYVSEKLLDALAETASESPCSGVDLSYMAALERCRAKLTATDDELLGLRYVEDLGSREIADQLQRPQQSVCQSLRRIRRSLLECVQMELAQAEHSREPLA
jgi:RNA polymerase sigma-70 factor, ECF subfamily